LIYIPLSKIGNSVKLNKISQLLLVLAILSSSLLFVDSSIELHNVLTGYSSFPYQVKEETNTANNFLIFNNNGDTQIVTGSLQMSSGLYEKINDYDIQKLNMVFSKPALPYIRADGSKINKNVLEVYDSLNEGNVNKFVISDYELNNRFCGDLATSPLNSYEMVILKQKLDENENRIYDSGLSVIYDFN
jgi:hypothetical protein